MINKDYGYYYTLPEEQYERELKSWYKGVTGEELNLENPQTYNEKIQWLKFYDSTPLKTRLADKYLVREWVAERIGEEYLIPLLGVWDSFDEIDFDALPDQFVLKGNHGSGYNYIVKDKKTFDKADAKAKFDRWMRESFTFVFGMELHYNDIKPRIIAEKFIQNENSDLYDYKVFCYNGKAENILFMSERSTCTKSTFFDLEWNKISLLNDPEHTRRINKPKNLEHLLRISENLATGFPHARVDFYQLDDGKYFFGEITFTSASGTETWKTEEIAHKYGDLIPLPQGHKKPLRPAVSLILHDHDGEKGRLDNLERSLAQLYPRMEVVNIDDGEYPEFAELVKGYEKKDGRIRNLECKNMSSSAAYHAAIENARGDFIIFADSKMLLEQEWIIQGVRQIAEARADILILDTQGGYCTASNICTARQLPKRVLENVLFALSDMIIRKSYIEQKRIRFVEEDKAQKICFSMEALLQCERVAVSSKAFGNETKHISCFDQEQLIHTQIIELMNTFQTRFTEEKKKEIFSRWYADLALGLSLYLLKTYEGELYERQYKMLKTAGLKALGLDKLGENAFSDVSRYRQMCAILKSDSMIRFV